MFRRYNVTKIRYLLALSVVLWCNVGQSQQRLGDKIASDTLRLNAKAQKEFKQTFQQKDAAPSLTDYIHKLWTSEQGLPHNSATALCQTRNGYLWIGTGEGLVRFDGNSMTVFSNTNTPGKSHYINALVEDRTTTGALLIGTGGGLYRFHKGVFTHFTTANGLSDNYVYALLQDPTSGTVWVGTGGGLQSVRLNERGEAVFKHYTANEGLPAARICALAQDREGAIVVGTWGNGVYRIRQSQQGNITLSHFTTDNGLLSNFVRSLFCDEDGTLWIGSLGGLNRLHNGVFTGYTANNGLSNNDVLSLLRDAAGLLWIGTNGGGVNLLRSQTTAQASKEAAITQSIITHFPAKHSLSQESVRSLVQDKEGALWIGTYSGGLHRLKVSIFTSYSAEHGLSDDHVTAVVQDRFGAMWFGTAGGGVNRLQNGAFTSYTVKNGLPSNYIQTLCADNSAAVWVGTWGGGVSRLYNGVVATIIPARDTAKNNDVLRALLHDAEGAIWIGTSTGLREWKGGALTTYTTKNGLSHNDVQTLLADNVHPNVVWIGTWGGGLDYLSNGVFTHYSSKNNSDKNGMSNNFVRALYQDRDGVLWIGTDGGGLNRLKNAAFAAITTKNGLFDDRVRCILEDDFGYFWISCNRGIYCVRKDELNDVADGKQQRLFSTVFGSTDGIRNVQCTGAGWKDTEGCLWFPTRGGVVQVNPRSIHAAPLPPTVILEEIQTNNENRQLVENTLATLPEGVHTLQFRYTATSLLAAERVRFRYKLEGYDADWTDAGERRTAYYTNLPHGRKYRFRVIACNNYGVWNTEGASLAVYLTPYFWETWWFLTLVVIVCVAAAVVAGYTVYRWRTARLRRRSEELEGLVLDRTATLLEQTIILEKINAEKNEFLGIAAHDLKNPLSGIQGTAELLLSFGENFSAEERQQFLNTIHQSSERMFELIKNLLDINALENGGVKLYPISLDPNTIVTHTIDQYSLRAEKKNIRLHYTGAENITLFADEPATMQVLENLVSNAVKYSPHGKNVYVRLLKRGEMARIEIQDEGPGISADDQQKLFGRFARLSAEPTGGEHSTGLGLSIVKKLVEEMNGNIWCESELGKGACFIVELPSSSPVSAEPESSRNQHSSASIQNV